VRSEATTSTAASENAPAPPRNGSSAHKNAHQAPPHQQRARELPGQIACRQSDRVSHALPTAAACNRPVQQAAWISPHTNARSREGRRRSKRKEHSTGASQVPSPEFSRASRRVMHTPRTLPAAAAPSQNKTYRARRLPILGRHRRPRYSRRPESGPRRTHRRSALTL
jgi:hypothetical protein